MYIEDRQTAKSIKVPKRQELQVFTDGLGIDGMPGAAATTKRKDSIRHTLRYRLGRKNN